MKQYYRLFLCLIIFYIIHPLFLSYPITPGLDNSWAIGLQLATQKGLWFGKDIIFTYGPLAFLVTRCPINAPSFITFIFDFFVMANMIYILLPLIQKLHLVDALISLIWLFGCNDLFNHDVVPLLYIIMGYYLIHNLKIQNPVEIGIAGFISLLLFFVKLNFGLFSILIFSLFTIYLLVFSRVAKRYVLICIGVYGFILFGVARIFHVYLSSYILNSAEIVKGYPGAMYNAIYGDEIIFLIAAILFIIYVVFLVVWLFLLFLKNTDAGLNFLRSKDFSVLIFVIFFVTSTIFILFKQSFTRADLGHTPTFFKFIIPLICLLMIHQGLSFQKSSRVIVVGCMLLIILVIQAKYMPTLAKQTVAKYSYMKEYYRALLVKRSKADDVGNLSKNMRDIIGNKTVDIIPTEISLAYYNKLNYHGRPVFQSYSAYTGELDSRNAESYSIDSAPEFLLFSAGSIDFRYFFWDESKTKFEILKRYDIALIEKPFILFKKKKKVIEFAIQPVKTFRMKMNEYYDLPQSTGLVYGKVTISYNLIGKARKFFYQPPELGIMFMLKNGQEVYHKAICDIISAGVLINKYIPESNTAVAAYHLSQGLIGSEVLKVKFMSSMGSMFYDEILVEGIEYKIPESSAIDLDAKTRDLFMNSKINGAIDSIDYNVNYLTVRGRAVLKEKDYGNLKTEISLISGGEHISVGTAPISKPGLSINSEGGAIPLGEFISMIDYNLLKPGLTYSVFISILDKDRNLISCLNSSKSIRIP